MAKLKTGRHTSALKANRQSERRRVRNESMKSRIKTLSKKVESAVAGKDLKAAQTLLRAAYAEWDKAVKTGIIHSNKAANQKSRLAKLVGSVAGQG